MRFEDETEARSEGKGISSVGGLDGIWWSKLVRRYEL
jgi:hypothetical protein